MSEHGLMAAIGLLVWIPFALFAFFSRKPERAALMVILGATMFGPELAFFKLPSVPPLDKQNIPYLIVLALCLVRIPRRVMDAKPGRSLEVLALVMAVGAIFTFYTNQDDLAYGSWITTHIPGLTFNDGMFMAVSTVFNVGIPFFLGRMLFRKPADLRNLLLYLALSGLLYSLFIWVEVRLSPQFHVWVYGYGAHPDFLQTIRWGGYRPMVFMAHGLAVGMLALVAALSAVAIAREKMPILRMPGKWVAVYLVLLLLVCKSTGAIIYGFALVPVMLYMKPRTQVRIAFVLAILALLYPLARSLELIPTEQLVGLAEKISQERADSLAFRFDNEEVLLEKAKDRYLFGWGEYGRNAIFDDEIGTEISVADGYWIILLGMKGAVGVLCGFGLILFPLFSIRRKFRLIGKNEQPMMATLALVVAVCGVDLIPNGLFAAYPYLLSGALYGLTASLSARTLRERRREREERRRAGARRRALAGSRAAR